MVVLWNWVMWGSRTSLYSVGPDVLEVQGPGFISISLFSMIRAVLICAFAAYASTVSAAPVLAPHAGDGLDARLAQLEAKVKALEVGYAHTHIHFWRDTDAKKVSEKFYGGSMMTAGSFPMMASSGMVGGWG